MKNYPQPKRDSIIYNRISVSDSEKKLAREFNFEYFDGPRKLGLGGFKYIEGYWSGVVRDLIKYYDLDNSSSILDIGCGKGFTLFDFCFFYSHFQLILHNVVPPLNFRDRLHLKREIDIHQLNNRD